MVGVDSTSAEPAGLSSAGVPHSRKIGEGGVSLKDTPPFAELRNLRGIL